jgi:hypothetical protein
MRFFLVFGRKGIKGIRKIRWEDTPFGFFCIFFNKFCEILGGKVFFLLEFGPG